MTGKSYLIWFLSVVAGAVLAIAAFNEIADRIILGSLNGKSVQTVTGFERVLKPAWIDTVKPDMVFVGSSQIREGFDPALIDPALHLRSFNYGISSATAYEVRRLFQDAAAQPSVKTIVVAADAFYTGTAANPLGGGFDELRLAVQADGAATPRRQLWLFTTRYLSGGSLGMHALGLYDLAQLGRGTAADRPDLFSAYTHMTPAIYRHDTQNRQERKIAVSPWQREQWRAALAAICHRGDVHTYLFFSPSNFVLIDFYLRNGTDGVIAFKRMLFDDVKQHNATCEGKITLFDFMYRNALTTEMLDPKTGVFASYADLVHFRPPVGVRLMKRMLGGPEAADASLGMDLTNLGDKAVGTWFASLTADDAAWRRTHH